MHLSGIGMSTTLRIPFCRFEWRLAKDTIDGKIRALPTGAIRASPITWRGHTSGMYRARIFGRHVGGYAIYVTADTACTPSLRSIIKQFPFPNARCVGSPPPGSRSSVQMTDIVDQGGRGPLDRSRLMVRHHLHMCRWILMEYGMRASGRCSSCRHLAPASRFAREGLRLRKVACFRDHRRTLQGSQNEQ